MEQNETIEVDELIEQNDLLRKRLSQVRSHVFETLDDNDRLRRHLKQRRNLLGQSYRHQMFCSDGRVWARPADSARRETIRWFAGNALTGLLASGSDDDTVAIQAAALIAFDLWGELEKAFDSEVEKQAAQNDTSQDDTNE